MPFSKVVESREVVTGSTKKVGEGYPMQLRIAIERCMRSRMGFQGEINNAKMTGCELFGEYHAAYFSAATLA